MKGSSDGHLSNIKFDGQRWEKEKIKGKGALSLETVYPSLAQTSAATSCLPNIRLVKRTILHPLPLVKRK